MPTENQAYILERIAHLETLLANRTSYENALAKLAEIRNVVDMREFLGEPINPAAQLILWQQLEVFLDQINNRLYWLDVDVEAIANAITQLFSLAVYLQTDWSVCGVGRGSGIPDLSGNRVNAVSVHGVTEGLGAGSQTAALQAAIAAEAANRTPGSEQTTTRQLYLPSGDYLLSTLPRVVGVELVGEADTTLHISQNLTFDAGLGVTRYCDVDDTLIAKGATSATLSGVEASYFSNGQAFLTQEDGYGVDSVGVEGEWTTNGFAPVRNKGYAINVVSRVDHGDGTYTVTWEDPSPFSIQGVIKAHRYGVVSEWAGIRGLAIQSANLASPIATAVQFFRCRNVWLKDVTLRMFNTRHVRLESCSNVTIEGCTIAESRHLAPSGSYGIEIQGFPTQSLIRDNIIVGMRSPIVISGGAQNAVLENYLGNQVNLNSAILVQTMSFHAAHPRGYLLEGNWIEGAFTADNTHGNNAGNVLFQNYVSGRSVDARHGVTTTTRNIAVRIDQKNWDYAIVGNVMGWEGMSGVYEIQAPNPINEAIPTIHRWQYASDGVAAGDLTDLNLTLTANFDFVNGATQYDGDGAVELPASLFYEPGSVPAHLPVRNHKTGAVNATPLPAKARYEAAGGRSSLILANESSLVSLASVLTANRIYQDVWVDAATNTAYAAVWENRIGVYDIDPVTKELTFIKQVIADYILGYYLHYFDGILWAGGEDGKLCSIIPSNNNGVFVQGSDIGTRVLDIKNNGTFLIVSSRDAIHSVQHTGGGAWAILDTLVLEGDTFAVAVEGNDIFASDRTTSGRIYHVTVDGSGILTNQGIVADAADARRGMYIDGNNLYVGIHNTPAIRHYTRVGGALTAQADYSVPALPNTVRRNGDRLYVATNLNELVAFNINTGDGTLSERARTTGLNRGKGAFPFGAYFVAYAQEGNGLFILEDV